jgi:LacI family transcriptional regulator
MRRKVTIKKNSPATLSEVARAAGVGTTTVSRVINGGDRVNPKTLAKVLRVIESMGYMPNQAARVLKGDRTKTIGLIIPSIADPFFSSCAEAAQAVARKHDSLLIVTTTQNDLKGEIEIVNRLVRHRVDGLIIAAGNSGSKSLSQLLQRLSMPVVAIDRPISSSHLSAVVTDNYAASKVAVQHLIEHGRKRIVCLTGERELFTIQERIRGYRTAIKQAGLPALLDPSVCDFDSALKAIRRLMSSPFPPDAFFTLKNSTTIYAFEVLQKLGIAVPDAIAMVGFDDFELASTLRPSISVLQQPVEEIGRTATELLFDQLPGSKGVATMGSQITKQLILETHLVRRRSCGCSSVD